MLVFYCSACNKLCQKPNIDFNSCIIDSAQLENALIGVWDWTQNKSGWVRGQVSNPCKNHLNKRWEFYASRSYKYFENGTLTFEGTYSLSVHDSITYLFDHPYGNEIKICENYLVMVGPGSESDTEIYLKRK